MFVLRDVTDFNATQTGIWRISNWRLSQAESGDILDRI